VNIIVQFGPGKGPGQKCNRTNLGFLADAESIAPTTFQVLWQVSFPDIPEKSPRKDRDLVGSFHLSL